MSSPRGRAWKLEQASVNVKKTACPHSNKHSSGDSHAPPAAGTRQRVWVGGYARADGTSVRGHYRSLGKR
jgi:hypothetical protein